MVRANGYSVVDGDDAVAADHASILGVCLAAGLARPDADDVAQDVWEWVLRNGMAASAVAAPWIAAVARNFIMRSRRRSSRHRYREGVALEMVPEPQASLAGPTLEAKELLDTLAEILPEKERALLLLVRKGHSLARAAEILGIPRGSRAYYSGRLIRVARRAIRGQKIGPSLTP
jgi:DNA-directed RNA polymerase specialized sigma24 family protein